jgi:hypothetical protein
MKKLHDIQDLHFEGQYLVATIDNKPSRFALKDVSKLLAAASEKERNTYEVSPAGYGIHWPLLDEDLAIDSLLGLTHKKPSRQKSA